TDVSGSVAIPNGSVSPSGGIRLDGGGNRIGGSAPGEGNLISGNFQYGIAVESSSNQVLGNLIGIDAAGTANLANTSDGIYVGGSNNVIGGTAANAGNIIAFNGGDGIDVANTAGTGQIISGNSIFSNSGIGIDLGGDGVTTNDTGPPHDIDTGPNNLQNYPVLTFASTGGGNTIIIGTFNSTASTTFTLEFFSSTVADGTGYGEGEVYLGSDTVATDGSGNASFIIVLPVAVTVGDVVTATATDPGNNTSEFSNALTVSDGALIEFEAATASDAEATGGNIPNLIVTGNVGAGETIDVTVTGGSATPGALNDYTNTVTITIPAGSYTNSVATPISLTINDDAVIEGNEDIQFALASPTAGLIIGDANVDTSTQSTHTYTIIDDEEVTVSGTVFEDVNYGGGTGRNLAAANADKGSYTLERGGVTVELYDDPAGNYISNTVTAVDGTYSFTALTPPANYTVRVVNSTVTSVRTGSNGSEVAVQTFRMDGASEGAGTGATKVGGEQPADMDAPANNTTQTLANLQAPGGQYTQSIITVDASGGDVTGVDFGFNFDTIVNTNNSGQGSLRQLILNANLLTDNASLAQNGLTAGVETSIFMIPSATDPLGRPADPNYNGSGNGEFTIQPGTALPVISDPVVLDGSTQPGFGGSPIIELDGTLAGAGHGLEIT
ncbi:MAG: hypothetical protein V3R81_05585, partial [Gammaproteobacteria bacterium]